MWCVGLLLVLQGCEFIQRKKPAEAIDAGRKPVARVNDTFLYRDDLEGLVTAVTTCW